MVAIFLTVCFSLLFVVAFLNAVLELGVLNELYLHGANRASLLLHGGKNVVQLRGLIHLAVMMPSSR